jgi:hypothetical protein
VRTGQGGGQGDEPILDGLVVKVGDVSQDEPKHHFRVGAAHSHFEVDVAPRCSTQLVIFRSCGQAG